MKKKIFFVDQYNRVGGGQSVLIDLLSAYTCLGYECHVALPEGGYVETKVQDVTFHYFKELKLNNGKKQFSDYFKLLKHYASLFQIRKKISGFDFVYVNGSRYFFLFYYFSLFSNSKFIYHIHLDFNGLIKKGLASIAQHKNSYALVFTSKFVCNRFTASSELTETVKNKLKIIEPCYGKKYEELPARVRFLNEQQLKFVAIGRIIPEKGLDLFIDVARSFPQYSFNIIGAPEHDTVGYYQYLQDTAPANLKFLGSSGNIPELIDRNGFNIGIVPSRWEEPFGIVAIELMLCSCYTFVIDRGGLSEIAEKTGAAVFSGQEDLRAKINEFLSAPPDRKQRLSESQYGSAKAIYGNENFRKKIRDMMYAIRS